MITEDDIEKIVHSYLKIIMQRDSYDFVIKIQLLNNDVWFCISDETLANLSIAELKERYVDIAMEALLNKKGMPQVP